MTKIRKFLQETPREMAKSPSRLLILVIHALYANINAANMPFNAIRENF